MPDIEFKKTTVTSMFGTLMPGDILRNISDEAAQHLVEIGAANYLQAAEPPAEPKNPKPKARKKAR